MKPEDLEIRKNDDDDHTSIGQYVIVNPALNGNTIAEITMMTHRKFIILANDLPDSLCTEILTFSAELTKFFIQLRSSVFHGDRAVRTDFCAYAATGTFLRIILNFLLEALCLRIMAPQTLLRQYN